MTDMHRRCVLTERGQRLYHLYRTWTGRDGNIPRELSVDEMVRLLRTDAMPLPGRCLGCGLYVQHLIEGLFCFGCVASTYREGGRNG